MIRFLLFIYFSFFVSISFGQFSGIGANVGGNASEFVEEEAVGMTPNEQKNKYGANAGIKFEWNLFQKEWLKLSPELYFIQKGSKEFYSKQSLIQAITDKSLNLDYSGICLPLKFEFNGNRSVYHPSYGYRDETFTWGYFQANLYGDYTFSGATSIGETIEFENTVGRIDYGFSVNAGIAVANGVFVQVGYQRGLKNINFLTVDVQNNTGSINYLVQNKNFTVAIAYQLKID